MALHDPVEDALNARKAKARRVEAGDAFSPDDLDITKKFLGGAQGTIQGARDRLIPPPQPPLQAADIARERAFGQRGRLQRNDPRAISPLQEDERVRDTPFLGPPNRQFEGGGGSLSDRFFNLPSPVGFAQTPQGRAILQRILGGFNRRGVRRL